MLKRVHGIWTEVSDELDLQAQQSKPIAGAIVEVCVCKCGVLNFACHYIEEPAKGDNGVA